MSLKNDVFFIDFGLMNYLGHYSLLKIIKDL